MRKTDGLIAALLASGALGLYATTLAPTVLAGDSGEFQFVPYLAGVAHPTGYPLYCLLGWAWSHLLPWGDVAHRMNLFSAFWAALAVGLLYPTALALLRQAFLKGTLASRRLLAVLAAATFVLTPTFWSQSIVAEVYSLHIFFVVLVLYLLLTFGQRIGEGLPAYRRLLLAAGCFGLSLAHHSTTVLLAPAILVYVWLARRAGSKGPAASSKRQVAGEVEVGRNLTLGRGGLLLAACCLPLLLYLYIPLRAPHTPYLHLPLSGGRGLVLYENTWTNLLDFVTGGPFGGSVDFSVDFGTRLVMAWGFLRSEVGWVGAALALIGVVRLAITRKWALLALTGLIYGATVTFNLVYTIGDIYVLFIPSYLVVVLWMVVGLGAAWEIGKYANGQIGKSANKQMGGIVSGVILVLGFGLPVWLGVTHYAGSDQSDNTRARDRWQTILDEPLPADAVLVSDDRNNIMPLWYFQYVGHQRPDLLGLFPLITPDYPTLGPILDLALSTEWPVYLIKGMPGVEVKVRVEAEGGLWRVVGPAVDGQPAYPMDAHLDEAVALIGYDQEPRNPRPGQEVHVSLYWQVLRPLDAEYHTFVHLLDAAGDKVAQNDRQPGGVFYPSTLWQPGERLRDEHVLAVPADAAPGVYRLLVGMYALPPGGELEPLGEPVVAGQIIVEEGLPDANP
jgi:hypothetical protein